MAEALELNIGMYGGDVETSGVVEGIDTVKAGEHDPHVPGGDVFHGDKMNVTGYCAKKSESVNEEKVDAQSDVVVGL